MGLRFRKSFKLFPGVRLNVSRSGLSTSFGIPGATVNVGCKGLRGTVGIPGTGLSYSANLTLGPGNSDVIPRGAQYWAPTPRAAEQFSPLGYQVPDPAMNSIASASVERLTTPSLLDLKQMIVDARAQRLDIKNDVEEAKRDLLKRERELRIKGGLLKPLFKGRVTHLIKDVSELRNHIGELNAWFDLTHIEVSFDASDAASSAFAAVIRAFDTCRTSSVIWDVTADRKINRTQERTTAGRCVDRKPVRFDYDDSDLVRFAGRAMRMTNANGDDLLIYPGILLVPRVDGQFALLDLREVVVSSGIVNFIEEEGVPPDSQVVGHAWAKANKDGSPDRRFSNNYQIPVCQYGRLHLGSSSGLNEEFQISNPQAALALGRSLEAYASALAASP